MNQSAKLACRWNDELPLKGSTAHEFGNAMLTYRIALTWGAYQRILSQLRLRWIVVPEKDRRERFAEGTVEVALEDFVSMCLTENVADRLGSRSVGIKSPEGAL